MSESNEKVRQNVERRVDYSIYFLKDCLEMVRMFFNKECFSDEVNLRFDALLEQVSDDIGDLVCDEFVDIEVVEYGFN